MSDQIRSHTAVWNKARDIIVEFLKLLNRTWPDEVHEKNAAALIAHLASAEPPLLICEPQELKE